MADEQRRSPAREGVDDWAEYRRLVLMELERINRSLDRLNAELASAKTDIALLQLKASAWGAVSGGLVAVGIILMRFIQ